MHGLGVVEQARSHVAAIRAPISSPRRSSRLGVGEEERRCVAAAGSDLFAMSGLRREAPVG